MFARRAQWDLDGNDLSRRIEERRRAGLPVLDLCASNPTECGLTVAASLLRSALAELASDPRSLRYAPDPAGDLAARGAIAGYHAGSAPPDGGPPVDPANVVLTAGTSEAYAHLFRLLGDPGDSVLVPAPSYPLFELLAGLEGLRAVQYPLRLVNEPDARDGAWRIDFSALEAAADHRARAVIVVHPNNPTGSFLRADDAARLRRLCAERQLALVSDEVFADYAFGAGDPGGADPARRTWPASLLGRADEAAPPLTFVLSGASKVLALPQLKLAWIVVAGPPALRDGALRRLEVIADAFLSVGGPAQLLLPRLLAGRREVQAELRARLDANRRTLATRFGTGSPAAMLPADGGWYAILRVPADPGRGPDGEDALVTSLLEDHGVLVQPGWFFDLVTEDAAHLVLSLLPEPGSFSRGVDAIAEACRR